MTKINQLLTNDAYILDKHVKTSLRQREKQIYMIFPLPIIMQRYLSSFPVMSFPTVKISRRYFLYSIILEFLKRRLMKQNLRISAYFEILSPQDTAVHAENGD